MNPRFGVFDGYGGHFLSELLAPALEALAAAVDELLASPDFRRRLRRELRTWAGRPTPLTQVPRFSARCRLDVHLKREDLLHGGAHKTNNAVGQALLAKELGKRRLIAETGAGQHGVATAMAGARQGLEVVVYMGAVDAARQRANVDRMRLCGAEVRLVESGGATLKEAIDEALRDWVQSVSDTHYVLGTVCGPDPYPRFVAELQRVIGDEARAQILRATGSLPDGIAACVGGGSNAIGLFRAFLADEVAIFGVEAAGRGTRPGGHGMTLQHGRPGLLHGARTYVLQGNDGQIGDTHSIAAGLDYPGVGPEHAMLRDRGRVRYVGANDADALAAFDALTRDEGILPALESSHALAFAMHAVERGELRAGQRLLVNLSGRGDKDLATVIGERRP